MPGVHEGRSVLLTWLGLVLAGFLGLRAGANALILRGLRAPRAPHSSSLTGFDWAAVAVSIPTCNGKKLFAWFVPAPGIDRAPTVVVMHGWGANANMMLDCVAPLHAAGFAVLVPDARCHGQSDDEAHTSLPRFAEDIEAGLNWVARQAQVDPNRIALMGHSVGAGAALLCATRRADVRSVVSISAFAHPREVMRRFLADKHIPYPLFGWYILRHVQAVIGAGFDSIAPVHSMARAGCPVLLVHGTEDEMVPIDDARRLLAAGRAGQVELIEVDGRHDPSDALVAHLPVLTSFLQRTTARPVPDGGEPG